MFSNECEAVPPTYTTFARLLGAPGGSRTSTTRSAKRRYYSGQGPGGTCTYLCCIGILGSRILEGLHPSTSEGIHTGE